MTTPSVQPLPQDRVRLLPPGWVRPDLGALVGSDTAAAAVGLMSARAGGVSQGVFAACNLGDHVQDDAQAVQRNRETFADQLGAPPVWLQQVHGDRVVRLTAADVSAAARGVTPVADGACTTEPGVGCVVMVADCLPLLLAAPEGRGVAALHAGWRGLAGVGQGLRGGQGIVHSGVQTLCEAASCAPVDVTVWLGPCIGPTHFEVGPDVLEGFGVEPSDAISHPRFKPHGAGKWLADLPGLASDVLQALGVRHVRGGDACTVSDPVRFFSFRRDGRTGRQAAGICLR
jgi:polyphenol oxidase